MIKEKIKLKEEYEEAFKRIFKGKEKQTFLDKYYQKEQNIRKKNYPKEKKINKTYPQAWGAYDRAKTNEDILFKNLLQELLHLSVEEPVHKRGRKGYCIKDKIFCMCIKIYYKSDLRKCESILKELRRLNYISQVPCYKSIDNFLNDKNLIEVLDNLILISSLPMAKLEETGSIDATGFSIYRFENWNKYKWGQKEGRERTWRKLHLFSGCKSNIVVSAILTKKNIGDISMVEKVIGDKSKYFDMKTFVADKAYSSRKVLNFIDNLGLIPFIPFKKNATGKARGSYIWRLMFEVFNIEEEYFLKKYHARSNVETTFSMIKRKFGNNILTKNFVANHNEIKTMCLVHNLCCLIQEYYESNIDIDFFSCVKKVAVV